MSLRGKFILYLVLIHLVFGATTYLLLAGHRIWLLALEGFFVVSFLVGLALIRSLFEPIRLIRSGVDLMKASDFGTRFRPVGQPELDPLIDVYNRMAENLRTERIRGQEQEHFLQRIITTSPSAILILDLDGNIAMANPSAEALLKQTSAEMRGNPLADLPSPLAADLSGLELEAPRLHSLSGRRRLKCQALSFMDRGFARRFILIDELTEELHRSEKAAYEKLIRMLSHEVNNTTGAVGSLLQSCLNYRDQIQPADRDDFENAIGVAISRTGHMNRFMRDFADVVRLPDPHRTPTEVEPLLREVVLLMRQQNQGRPLRWQWRVEAELPPIAMDPVQMEQVFINVIKNAVEATGADGVITLTLGTEADRPFTTIGDNGHGFSRAVREKLFTPFFTSKENGQGIGLTLVQEILIGHGFDYSLERTEAGVTEFRIWY